MLPWVLSPVGFVGNVVKLSFDFWPDLIDAIFKYSAAFISRVGLSFALYLLRNLVAYTNAHLSR